MILYEEEIRMDSRYIIGMMSGTSMDGIDAALVKIKEQREIINIELIEFITKEYPKDIRRLILKCCNIEKGQVNDISKLRFILGDLYTDTVYFLLEQTDLEIDDIDLIGFHGQTIYHEVDCKIPSTFQVCTAAKLAQSTGITTVNNFRVKDIAAGGKGAPLVPYTDYLIYASQEENRVLQNIGGIGNYTYLPAGANLNDVEGSDTGPGNMLIDNAVYMLTDGEKDYDVDGKIASRGEINKEFLMHMMNHSFIKKKTPRTAGRKDFGSSYVQHLLNYADNIGLSKDDIIATITAFTAYSIIDCYYKFINGNIDKVILSGGGAYNPTLVKMIEKYLDKFYKESIEVVIMEDIGYSSEAKEAEAMAVLAYQTMKGRYNNLPQVTGASSPVIMGNITPGDDFYNYLKW